MKLLITTSLAAAALFGAGEARAAPPARAFEVAAVADAELDGVRGGAPLPALTAYAVRRMAEEQARFDFMGTGQVARTVVDNWLNDVGAQLVADSLAAQGR